MGNDSHPDAFQLLMASSIDGTKLPKKYDNPQTDNRLLNDIVDWLRKLFGLDTNSTVKTFVVALHDAPWYIDGHWKTLSS